MVNPAELWKAQKHGFDVWPDVLQHASARTPMAEIATPDLERMKWHGFFYRKRDEPGRYMNRIRITANELTSEQARTVALIAYELGHGIVDVTTRANLQVQGLEIQHIPPVAERLAAVGLTSRQTGHDNIRNVFGHPFSGVLPDELIDTRELCHAVTGLFLDSREYADLPRKLNICLNGAPDASVHFWSQDLSFLACDVDGQTAFQVLIGGTQGQNPRLAWHLPVLVAAEQVVDVTRAILDLFRSCGSREKRHEARLRYLIERIGLDGVREWLADRVLLRAWPEARPAPMPATQYDDLIGWFRQPDPNRWTMGLCVPLGRLSWKQLEAAGVLAARWGRGALRTTHEQGLAVIDIPTGFRDAAATDAAAVGLSVHADTLARNTMACTGTQFCNIAVTETKGTMFGLITTLRQRALALHGIRIHMSGCPSSCAQHFTADIGLKGVRVRRLLGAREGFDVFLGGGVAGEVHLGLRYKLGVDVQQLPLLIEEVVHEYYLRHRAGQTFSAYWRERLRQTGAAKVGDDDYQPSTWMCDACDHRHRGEDPPVFCPGCAGTRRLFARLEASPGPDTETTPEGLPVRGDGFVFAGLEDALHEGTGLAVEIGGHPYALFRSQGQIQVVDGTCPHEGGPLAEGTVRDSTLTCPWHGWTFDTRSGCSLDPPGCDLRRYETLVEDGRIHLKPAPTVAAAAREPAFGSPRRRIVQPASATLTVAEVLDEAPEVRTFRLDNREGRIPHEQAGTFVTVHAAIDEQEISRSFSVSSSPKDSRFLDLTIKRNPTGRMTNFLFAHVGAGSRLALRGTQGGFVFDPSCHNEPVALISAGSGITPVMSMARLLAQRAPDRPCAFIHGARTADDILFHAECQRLGQTLPHFHYHVALSRPPADWPGGRGRLDGAQLSAHVPDLEVRRYFLCGPPAFMETLQRWLHEAGVPRERVHVEQFQVGGARVDESTR